MSEQGPVRVALVEDDPRFRESMRVLLEHHEGFEVAATFGNPRPLLRRAREAHGRGEPCPWDLVLMDLELPGMNGIEGTTALKALYPEVRLVVLTAFEEPSTILQAICAGADGYLLKKASARELVEQLRVIRRGGAAMSGDIARSVLDIVRRYGGDTVAPAPRRLELSEREQDVLRCMSRGRTYRQAADDLDVSVDTVRDHVRRIYRKLQVHSAAEAVALAVREGLI